MSPLCPWHSICFSRFGTLPWKNQPNSHGSCHLQNRFKKVKHKILHRWKLIASRMQNAYVQVSLLVKDNFACYLQRSTLAVRSIWTSVFCMLFAIFCTSKPAVPMLVAIFGTCKSACSATTWVLLRLLLTITRRLQDQEARGQVVLESRGQEVQEEQRSRRTRGLGGPGDQQERKKGTRKPGRHQKENAKKNIAPHSKYPMRIQDRNTSASTMWNSLPDLLPSTESFKSGLECIPICDCSACICKWTSKDMASMHWIELQAASLLQKHFMETYKTAVKVDELASQKVLYIYNCEGPDP